MSVLQGKQRLLVTKGIFENETDENHKLSLNELCDKIVESIDPDITIDPKAVRDDISALIDCGFSIDYEVSDRNKKLYYYEDRLFQLYELRMIIDAVSSARSISISESRNLISKLKAQTSRYKANELEGQITLGSKVKCENETVRYNIDLIHSAIARGHKIGFKYGKYNLEKLFVVDERKGYFLLSPYKMEWENDRYYLKGLLDGNTILSHFRVDRIREVEILDEEIDVQRFDGIDNPAITFNMFAGGEIRQICLRVHNSLINPIIDKFGIEIELLNRTEETFDICVEVADNEGLTRWLMNYGSKITVISPEGLKAKVREEINRMKLNYN